MQKNFDKKIIFWLASWRSMMKIEGSGSSSRGMDPRIRIRIHTKMSWIRNTAPKDRICTWGWLTVRWRWRSAWPASPGSGGTRRPDRVGGGSAPCPHRRHRRARCCSHNRRSPKKPGSTILNENGEPVLLWCGSGSRHIPPRIRFMPRNCFHSHPYRHTVEFTAGKMSLMPRNCFHSQMNRQMVVPCWAMIRLMQHVCISTLSPVPA